MTDKALKVLDLYLKLSDSDQEEVRQEINKYANFQFDESKKIFKEIIELRSASVGPKNSTCVCCGR